MIGKSNGWVLLVAGLGLFTTMVSVDIGQLQAWESALAPAFVGKVFGYFGAVIAAFVGGKLIPTGEQS